MTTFVIRPEDVAIPVAASVHNDAAAVLNYFCDRLRAEERYEEAVAVYWLRDEVYRRGRMPDADDEIEEWVLDGALSKAVLLLDPFSQTRPMITATSSDDNLRVVLSVEDGKICKITWTREWKHTGSTLRDILTLPMNL